VQANVLNALISAVEIAAGWHLYRALFQPYTLVQHWRSWLGTAQSLCLALLLADALTRKTPPG
jgi:hypothetical protein